MSTQAKQVLYSPVDIDDADFVDFEVDEKMESENAEFQAFKDEMHDAQDNAKITVGKKHTDSRGRPLGKHVFECFECGIDDYTFSQLCTRIREDFGSGLYQVLGRDSKGKFKFRKTVGVQAPKVDSDENPATDVGVLFDKFSDAMQRQQMQTEAMITKIVGPTNHTDTIDQVVKIAAAVAPLLTALGISRPETVQPKTLVEQLTEFKMIKELFGSDGDGDLSGGDDNIYSLLKSTVTAFGGPIAAALAAGAESGDLSPDGLATTARLPAPEPKTDEAMEQEKHNIEMRKNIHILIQNAKTEVPADAFAEILINHTPEDKQDQLWDFISSEKCVDEIIRLEPAAEKYREWFEALRDAVILLMSDPENEDLPTGDDAPIVAESKTVAGEDDPPHDPDNGDPAKHT